MNLLYQQIEQAIRGHAPQLSVQSGTTQDDVYQCIRSIMRENPDIFWFSHQWKYTEDDQTIRFHYTIDKERTLKAKTQIEDVVRNDFQINHVSHLSVPEQIMYVYKWIALYCKYNIYSAYNQTIYSVFVCRNSVCTGYAKAAQYLFKVLGIECKLVFGTLNNAVKGSRHCWLIVKIDGHWYHTDPTFADPSISDLILKAGVSPIRGAEELVYNYFCCSTRTIKQSRSIEDESELPECSSAIDYKPLQDLPISVHRTVGAEETGTKGCLLSDSGSYANVYLWHTENNCQKVVKVYKNDAHHKLLRHEFLIMREMAASRATLHVCGITDKQDGLIIEQATPLADLLCSHYYQLSAKHFCNLLLDVSEGLQDCISHRIYYRDIHLNNIYRTQEGRYVLGDFGSCIWTDKENTSNPGGVGSPWYVAPETYLYDTFDERSSTYGIGMLAYFILNELRPPLWTEYGNQSLKYRIEGADLPLPALLNKPSCSFEQRLASIIKKALSFDPAGRYQTLSYLRKDIERCLSSIGDGDYLLIDGGSAERLYQFGKKGLSVTRGYNNHTNFHSTSTSSEILVSNGENEPLFTVDTDDYAPADNTVYDDIFYVSNGCDEFIDTSNPNINDFAQTAGNPFFHAETNTARFSEYEACPPPGSAAPKSPDCRGRIDDYTYSVRPNHHKEESPNTYQPQYNHTHLQAPESTKRSFWSRLFGRKEKKAESDIVYSSVYAPAEVKPKSHLLVQVYLHLIEEEEHVAQLAVESDKRATRCYYEALQTNLKRGDTVNVELNIYGEALLFNAKKDIRWIGKFSKASFDYFVPAGLDLEDLSCEINLYANDVIVGNMTFITKIAEQPLKLNAEIISHSFKRIFISYAHQDAKTANNFALAYKAQGVNYFFDRDKLKAGDVFEEKIFEYIDSADLFILCWSANAAKSDYVDKELARALQHAYPQRNINDATLKIYPISIPPRAELPKRLSGIYNFEEVQSE